MQTYRRFVSYVYQYENGKKAGNRGFIKVEARGNTCSMQISLKGICKDENASCTVYGFKREDGLLKGSRLAECPVRMGVVQELLVFARNEMGEAKYGLQELSGVIFQGDDQTMYGTQWDDDPMKMENFQPDEKNEAMAEYASVPAEEAENRERWDESKDGEWMMVGAPVQGADLDEPGSGAELDGPDSEEAVRQELNGENEPESVADETAFMTDVNPEENEEQRQEMLYESSEEPAGMWESGLPVNEGVEDVGAEALEEVPLAAEMISGEEADEEEGVVETKSMDALEQNVKLTDVLDTTIPVAMLPGGGEERGGQGEIEAPLRQREEEPEYAMEFQAEADNQLEPEQGWGQQTDEVLQPEAEMNQEQLDTVSDPEAAVQPVTEPRQELEAAAISEPGRNQRQDQQKADRREHIPPVQAAKRGPKKNDQEKYIKPEPKNFCPFSDGVLEDCQKIKIGELKFLDSRDQNLRNNRFVQHGYQMFGHLLLARIARNGQYILGVPGMYQQQEKFMADMFGFHNFKYAKRGGPKQSGFGYWYRLIYPPKLDRGNGRPKQL